MKIKNIVRKIKPIVSIYHFVIAFLGALFYRFPSRKIIVLGVTGTNGKTTTVDLTSRIFKEAGFKVASFSSIRFDIAGEKEQNLYKMTMPGRAVLQKLLRKAVNKDCEVAIMEVSSEGIKQHRHRFIDFDGACFTNLSPEHIESHGGFDNYKKEKGKFFKAVKKLHVLNIDDKYVDYFMQFEAEKKVYYGINNNLEIKNEKDILLKADDIKSSKNKVSFKVLDDEFSLNLLGRFNVYNALAAMSFARVAGIKTKDVQKAFKKSEIVPGRMEEVLSSPFSVIIDYAVTPDTLEEVYKEIRKNFSPTRLIAVLGSCGGGRDKWKRPIMGKVAEKYTDKVIITNEDPYDEKPEDIINDIARGAGKKTEKIIDRREAIRKALSIAKKGDVIIITGKGDEPWMCLSENKKIPWNEREIIKEEFKKLKNK